MAERQRMFDISPDDHGGVAVVVATICMTWSVLCLFIRFYVRYSDLSAAAFGSDDILSTVATVLGVIETIVACVSVAHGFGKAQDVLGPSQHVSTFGKEQYAVTILCLITLAVTRVAMVCFHIRITPRRDHKRVAFGLLAFIVLVGVASVCIEAARCGGDRPWRVVGRQCSNYNSGWTAIAAMETILETAVFLLPVWIVFDLVAVSTKIVVISAFALRLPVIIAAIVHLYYVRQWLHSTRPFVAAVIPFICLQAEVHYAIIATTFPCFRPFMKSLNTRWGTMERQEARAYALETLPVKDRSGSRTKMGSNLSQRSRQDTDMGRSGIWPDRAHRSGAPAGLGGGDRGTSYTMVKSNRGSPSEQHCATRTTSDDSDRMMIHRTTETRVEYEHEL